MLYSEASVLSINTLSVSYAGLTSGDGMNSKRNRTLVGTAADAVKVIVPPLPNVSG